MTRVFAHSRMAVYTAKVHEEATSTTRQEHSTRCDVDREEGASSLQQVHIAGCDVDRAAYFTKQELPASTLRRMMSSSATDRNIHRNQRTE